MHQIPFSLPPPFAPLPAVMPVFISISYLIEIHFRFVIHMSRQLLPLSLFLSLPLHIPVA
jgi:hypothetical protein